MRNHSTISRRDFMKAIGLGAAGIGATAVSTPIFKDLDEIGGEGTIRGGAKLPWWIKVRKDYNPTTEVDWDLKERYNSSGAPSMTDEKQDEMVKNRTTLVYKGITENIPGDTILDHAFLNGSMIRFPSVGLAGPDDQAFFGTSGKVFNDFKVGDKTITVANAARGVNRADFGLPRYQGTPEENLNIIRRVASFWGCPQVGALEVTPQLKKMLYVRSGTRLVKWDEELGLTVNKPYQDTQYVVMPRSLKYVLVCKIPQSGISRHDLKVLGKTGTQMAYSDNALFEARMANFISTLGYNQAVAAPASNPGMGILAGLGELGRCDYMISPFHGALVRYSNFIFTDLPLATTTPIDAGIWRFCHTCKKCATTCPSQSLGLDDKPSWEVTGPWNGYGNKEWHINYSTCLPWRGNPGGTTAGGCGTCAGVCVFTKKPNASIHEFIKITQSTTGVFNGFFRTMDDLFGYGRDLNPNEFWDINKMSSYPFRGYGATIQ